MSATAELTIRLAAFAAVFALMALWELVAPRRPWAVGRAARWPSNLGIVVLDAVAVRTPQPPAAGGDRRPAEARGFGLFHWLGWRGWLATLVGFVILDIVIYGQHVAFHHVPWLWRLHRVHHADLDIDVTTGVRFHPIEILLSTVIKIAAVVALGLPAFAVLIFEVLLNATSMFNHSNVALPPRLEPIVRWIVVTPQMHQVHHSIERAETDSNFGFNLPW